MKDLYKELDYVCSANIEIIIAIVESIDGTKVAISIG